jgi:hypothetical protein
MSPSTRWQIAIAVTAVIAAVSAPAEAQWQIGSARGDTLRIGYLAQVRAEGEKSDTASRTSRNLYLRHIRLLVSGKLQHSLSFFLGTDSPNLGKTQSDGTKNNGDVGIFDFWITWAPRQELMLDMGLIGTPNSHNSIQSISGMLAPDFSPYSFVSTPPTGAKAGRDYGVQSRGYLLSDHVEYRVGVFEGYRGEGAKLDFRYLGRIVFDAFKAERSVYYSGTSLGVHRNLAVGLSADKQEQYRSRGGDIYFDYPLPNGDGVTLQSDVVRYDGRTTFISFPRQDAWLAEAGYFSKATRLTPFVQIARLDFGPESLRDRNQWLAGAAWFISGHALNIKAAFGKSREAAAPSTTIYQVTFQSLQF